MELEFLKSLVIILCISAVIVFVLGRLKISSIVGFLIAGVIVGPHGAHLISDVRDVELFAEIGVILLMFTIGLEFSLKNLLKLRRSIFLGGFIQIGLTIAVVVLLISLFVQHNLNMAIFEGFLVSLSSTAIVMKILLERSEIYSPHGRMSVGMLIFQDLCVVPFMLLIPVLAGNGGSSVDVLITMLTAALVVGIVLFASTWGVPRILHEVVSTRSRELFFMTIILLCLGTALITSMFGLSLALGAFLAGIVISESEYAAQAISDILPFKESFTGLFFMSVGMLLNLGFLRTHLWTISGIVVVIILIKIITAAVSASLSGQSLQNSIHTGFYLSQVGEFSFILAVAGKNAGLITDEIYQIFLSASVLTMIATPFVISVSSPAALWFISRSLFNRLMRMRRIDLTEPTPSKRAGHVIITGFGINGRNLAKVLRALDIPYVILEMNNNTVRKMKKMQEPIYYGDGTSVEILHKLGIHSAKVLVIAISDAPATRRIVQIARKENPEIHIIVRTRYVAEVDHLLDSGANEVIPEEFETSVEIFSRVLHHYNTPRNVISEHIENIRKDSYSVLRGIALPQKGMTERQELLEGMETETYLIRDTSGAVGLTLRELNLRVETGATIIAVKRKDIVHHNPSSDFAFKEGDILLLIGTKEDIDRAVEYIDLRIKSV
ncbi:MAG: cation:proton antiporter [Nitrospirae bacterium]|nr:cation:proton antiporter [Nitrospirota bacterium]